MIAISATFTAEPLADVLRFWSDQLGWAASLAFAGYNQVFQTLLDPASTVRRNRDGVNVVLLRFVDFGEDAAASTTELVDALRHAAGSAPLLAVTCPVDGDTAAVTHERELVGALESAINQLPGVHLLRAETIAARYPTDDVFDSHSDAVGHVPYSPSYFAALGTAIMRQVAALRRAPYKVIALDCDNTLWGGIVGEDGLDGISLDAGHRALQTFMVEQHDAGRLLCLASKNNAADVDEVFDKRSMPLAREHLVATCVDWNPKPHNLRRLATELSLGLDSFMFLDDSSVECAQMQDAAPEVLTLQVPEASDSLPAFLDHVWAFDQVAVTQTDRQRTAMYRENLAREQSRDGVATLAEFLSRLELVVDIRPLDGPDLPRASQLTQRTNQFNLTTIRRTSAEVAEFSKDDRIGLGVHVRDRFGDYGFVGLVLATASATTIDIDTFLLSCRALGRGVEHRMLAAVGSLARSLGCEHVTVRFAETAKNAPARTFFAELAQGRASEVAGGVAITLATSRATELELDTSRPADSEPGSSPTQPAPTAAATTTDRREEARRFQRIAAELRSVPQIVAALQHATSRRRDDDLGTYQAPQSDLEETVATLWADALGLDRVGRCDGFLALGGNSLAATRVISRLRATYEVELSLVRFFSAPTVAGVAAAIEDLILAELEAE